MKGLRKSLALIVSLIMIFTMMIGTTGVVLADEATGNEAGGTVMTFHTFTVEPVEAEPNDLIKVTVEFFEPETINYVLVTYDVAEGVDDGAVVLFPDGFTGEVEVTDQFANGLHTFKSMVIYRGEEEEVIDITDLEKTFTVFESDEDQVPPTGTATISGTEFEPGDEIEIKTEVRDDRAMGVVTAAALHITDPQADNPIERYADFGENIELEYMGAGSSEGGGAFDGKIKVTDKWSNGDYDVIIYGIDAVGNITLIDTIKIAVKNSLADQKAPVVGGASIDKATAQMGDKVTVTVTGVKDEAGTEITSLNAVLRYATETTIHDIGEFLEKVEGKNGEYQAVFTVDEDYLKNVPLTLYVQTTDALDNSGEIAFSDVTLTVVDAKEEPTEPAKEDEKPTPTAPTDNTSKDNASKDNTSKDNTSKDTASNTSKTETKPAASAAPKTGDAENMILWIALTGAAIVTLVAATKAKKSM